MCVMQDAIVMKCSLFELYALKNMPLLCGRQNTHLLSAFAVPYNQRRGKKKSRFTLFQFLLEILSCVSVSLHLL